MIIKSLNRRKLMKRVVFSENFSRYKNNFPKFRNFKRNITFFEWLTSILEKHPSTKKTVVPIAGFFSFCIACDYLYYRTKEYELIELDIELKRKELARLNSIVKNSDELKD